MSGTKGSKRYAKATKLEAVRLYLEEGLTSAEIAELLGLRRKQRVAVWVRQYRQEGLAAFDKPKGRPRQQTESLQAELERLRMENELLKKYHTELRKAGLAKRNIGSSMPSEADTQ